MLKIKKISKIFISLFIAISVLLSPLLSSNYPKDNTAAAYSFSLYTDNVAALVNQFRAENGLSPLKVIPVLKTNAQTRAKEIASSFSHTRPNGSDVTTVFSSSLVWDVWGENIAYGATSPESVMEQWKNSAGHRANMLNSDYAYIGVGAYISNGTIYWTQLFIGSEFTYDDAYTPKYKTTTEVETVAKVTLATNSGDVNSDGSINAKDAVLVLQDYANTMVGKSSTLNKTSADVNSDSSVNAKDATFILQYYAQTLAGI